jgi:hypothetical protein
MRTGVLAGAVAGLLAMSMVACASPRTAPTGAVAAPPDAVAAAGVCTDVARCQVVARTDVDGDARRDEVGFVVESKRHVAVLVRTASGRLLRRGLDTLWFPRGEFFGAAPIDGHAGAELVVGTTMGAHTLFFTTLTARSGRLVRLPPPGGQDEWMIDAAYSFHAGVTRDVRDGRAVVVLHDAGREGAAPRFSGRDRSYVWRAGAWRHLRTVRTRYRGEQQVSAVGGWHVPGLPRMPDF